MADSKNYKVNLVTDVQDLVKGNNELRATSRYIDSVKRAAEQFGRARYQSLIKVNTELKYMERHLGNIYSLAVRVGRLRVTPTVYLIDQAIPALERLLKKLKEVSSYAVVARANVQFKMQAIPAPATMMTKVDTTTTTTTTIEGLNMDGLIAALNTNTTAVTNLTTKLDSLKLDGGTATKEEPKGPFDSFLDFLGGGKSFGEGIKSLGESPEKIGDLKKSVTDFKTPGGSKVMKFFNLLKTGGALVETAFTAGEGIVGGTKDLIENGAGMFKSIFGGGADAASSAVSGASAASGATAAATGDVAAGTLSTVGRVAAEGATSGIFKGSLKALSKSLGPLSLIPDAISLATAENNEQRGAAIGSSILSTAGAALGTVFGSALPVVGNIALGAGLGIAGDWVGGKMGGMIGKMFDSPNTPMETTVTKSLASNGEIKVPDFSNVTGFPANPTSKMLAPKPTFADRYVVPIVENNMKPRVNNPAPVVPPVPQAASVANKPTITTTTKTSVQSTVQLSDGQMSSISGMLKDFKTNVTNSVSVNVPAGAVQVTVKENKIDYDMLANRVGQRIMVEVRKALENRKPTTAQPTS